MKTKWKELMIFLLSNFWKSTILKISVREKAMQGNYNHEKKKQILLIKVDYSWKINFNTHKLHPVFLLSMKNTEMQWELDILRFHILSSEIYLFIGIGRSIWQALVLLKKRPNWSSLKCLVKRILSFQSNRGFHLFCNLWSIYGRNLQWGSTLVYEAHMNH